MLGFNVFVIFLLVLFIFVVAAGVKIVPQGCGHGPDRFPLRCRLAVAAHLVLCAVASRRAARRQVSP